MRLFFPATVAGGGRPRERAITAATSHATLTPNTGATPQGGEPRMGPAVGLSHLRSVCGPTRGVCHLDGSGYRGQHGGAVARGRSPLAPRLPGGRSLPASPRMAGGVIKTASHRHSVVV